MLECFTHAIEQLALLPGWKAPPHAMSQFWGAHQRFFKQMCMAIKVSAVVRIAQRARAEGKCVVIGLQTTGEARLAEAIADAGEEGLESAEESDHGAVAAETETWSSAKVEHWLTTLDLSAAPVWAADAIRAASMLSADDLYALLRITKPPPSAVERGVVLEQYIHGEELHADSIAKLKALGPGTRTFLFTRNQSLVYAALREAADLMVRERLELATDADLDAESKQRVDEQFEQLVAQLVASTKTTKGKLRQFACAAPPGAPATVVVGFVVCRSADGLTFSFKGFADDFPKVLELLKRASSTGPAMEALIEDSCVVRLSPQEAANAMMTGGALPHGIEVNDLAASQGRPEASRVDFRPATVGPRQNSGMGGSASLYNRMSVRFGTLYLLMNINRMGGAMRHKDECTHFCLLNALGFLHFGITSMTPQKEPPGTCTLVVDR